MSYIQYSLSTVPISWLVNVFKTATLLKVPETVEKDNIND